MGTTAMATAGRAFRRRGLVAGLALALLVSVGTAATAGAERPEGNDTHAIGCRSIYNQIHLLLDEYKRLGYASNGTDPRLETILAQLRNLGSDWKALRCEDRFGSVVARVVPVEVHDIVADPVHDIVADPGQVITADPGHDIVADPGQAITGDPDQEIVAADPGQEVAADPGQDTPVPADETEIIVPGDEPGEVVIDDPVPAPIEDEQP